tara:strand:+ start:558 stop:1040 length:483 start_codon:yes stop_codon:yes gene_type:complete
MITRYKVEEKTTVPSNPNDEATVYVSNLFNTVGEAEAYIEKRKTPHPEIVREYQIIDVICNYANNSGYSDMHPYEIVSVISDKTIEIREMDSEELPWKRDFHEGGFFGHTANQDKQKWDIKSNEKNQTFKARLRKDGYFHSNMGKHYIEAEPRRFHDYNF